MDVDSPHRKTEKHMRSIYMCKHYIYIYIENYSHIDPSPDHHAMASYGGRGLLFHLKVPIDATTFATFTAALTGDSPVLSQVAILLSSGDQTWLEDPL